MRDAEKYRSLDRPLADVCCLCYSDTLRLLLLVSDGSHKALPGWMNRSEPNLHL